MADDSDDVREVEGRPGRYTGDLRKGWAGTMTGRQVGFMPPPDELDAYLDLSAEEISRIILCLLIEEALRGRLAVYRPQYLPTEPVEGLEELDVVCSNIVPVSDALW
jgi:hypothetical protein